MWDLLEFQLSQDLISIHISLNSDKVNQTTLSKFYEANKNGISQKKLSVYFTQN